MQYEPRLEWEENDEGDLVPMYYDENGSCTPVTWAPQPGSQEHFLSCPIFEVLYEGERGGGKTDCLLVDFYQEVGKGFGAEWRGILFRETYPQLKDVVNKSLKLFKKVCPGAVYNKGEHEWTFPGGEVLMFRHMAHEDVYWEYHGHAYPWIGWEELCNWKDGNCYLKMMSCCRSVKKRMPRRYRATTNPYGPGHNWVKRRFRLPAWRMRVIMDSYKNDILEPPRVAIRSKLDENKVLLHGDPDYRQKVAASATGVSELRAWMYGDWDIIAGGMFDDLWDSDVHEVDPFPFHMIPLGWKIDRAFDWGSSKPFSVGWWAQSNGEPVTWNGKRYGEVAGDLIRIGEWYGCTEEPNVGVRLPDGEVAQGILDREEDMGLSGRVEPGPADSQIFDDETRNIAVEMAKVGVRWKSADKGPGSRVQGWAVCRQYMQNSLKNRITGMRENPGLFVFRTCVDFINQIPSLPRDMKKIDDVISTGEDHIADEMRYRVRNRYTEFNYDDM